MTAPPILTGLRELADSYDALVCDVWGVVHDGVRPHAASCDALRRFRERGPVLLLSNAPRPLRDMKQQFARLGVPDDCYDAILTSGMAARDDLAARTAEREVAMFHLGPDRDRGIFEGLRILCTDAAHASIVLCTGLFDDEVETPEHYRSLFADLKHRRLTMLCANPDIVVQRGGKLVYCAGALAKDYRAIGGSVVYYGKPYQPIYDLALASLKGAKRPLAIGDGLETDIKGANDAGIDALFIGDGIHGDDVEPFTPTHLQSLLLRAGVHVRGAMRSLVW